MTTEFQGQQVVELQDGESRVLIAPQFGARLLTWEVGAQKILLWPEETDWSSRENVALTRGGNPILFPFVGRHYVDGEMGKWRDANGVVRPMPMHGFARDMPFEVVEHSPKVLRMRLLSNSATYEFYPFEWSFEVVYRLGKSTLTASFETQNLSAEAMPYNPGHHFYFAIEHTQRADWSIEIPCKTWGRIAQGGLPAFEEATQNQTTLDDPELVDRFHLDFTQPQIRLRNRELAREIRIGWKEKYFSFWKDVTTWTQSQDSDFFCVEPWLGLPNAIHHGEGLRWLEPGQKEVAKCQITVRELAM